MAGERIVGWLDEHGEVHDGVPVFVGRQRKGIEQIYGRRFFTMSQDPLVMLAKDKDLRGRPRAVLDYLLAYLDFENFVQVPQTEIAAELDIGRSHVSEAIKLLEEKGILLRGPKVGRSSSWRLNPLYGFKGDPRGKVRRSRTGELRLVTNNSERDQHTPDLFTGKSDAEAHSDNPR